MYDAGIQHEAHHDGLVDDVVARVAAGTANDVEVLACARWSAKDAQRLDHLRAVWPVDKLPIVGDYFCVSRLGQGASGVVFKAVAVRFEPEFVAVKLLKFSSPEEEERFRSREIEVLKALRCPKVARYVDSGTAAGTPFLVTEFVRGRSLDEYLTAETNSLEQKLAVFQRVCNAVGELHGHGVIHRDLKPKHVLINDERDPIILDFGLAAVRGDDWPTRIRHAQTELGHILGTVRYMAPEQAWGGLLRVDHRADIWALGVMLYEITTGGDHPYGAEAITKPGSAEALLHRIQTEVPARPRIRGARDTGALETLITRCLAFEPGRRIGSAADLGADLGRYLERQRIRTKRLPLWYRLERIGIGLACHWRPGLWCCTISAVVVFLLGVSMLFGARRHTAGEDFGPDTRQSIQPAGGGLGVDRFVIAGVFDESITEVPAWASAAGFTGVTADVRSWRAVHGNFMERLAIAQPRAVVWDFIFRTPQKGDADFVRGVRALDRAGVPVALATRRYKEEGQPDLSADLFEPVKDIVRHGLIMAHDLVLREGELVMVLRRNDTAYPSLTLSSFASIVQPTCRTMIDWQPPDEFFTVIYHPVRNRDRIPSPDRINLTTAYGTSRSELGVLPGDVIGCKAFSLAQPSDWDGQAVAYEKLLAAGDAEMADLVGGKIVIVGDLLSPHPLLKRDRHRVRYGTEIIADVPGCYLIADALNGLLANRYLKPAGPLTPFAFVGVAVSALLACMAAPKLRLGERLSSHGLRRSALLVLTGLALACGAGLALSRSNTGVHLSMFATAACLALAASLAIEFARNPPGRVVDAL